MFKKLFVAAVLIGLPALGHAAANGTIWNSVAVCDPLYPTHCVAPAADGSIPVTGAGGGGGGTSSNFAATFPTPGTAIGFKDSTGALMAPGRVDASNNLATFLATAIPAGSAIIGKIGIDQTTPGTTNGVQINAALPAGAAIVGKIGIDQTTPGTTNAVQVIGSLPAGTAVLGHVIADTGSTTAVTGTVAVNQTQMNGVAVSAGNGTTDTGTQRVTLSSDSTGQVIALGNVASGVTDSGAPVKIGSIYSTTGSLTANTAGQRVNSQADRYGNTRVLASSLNAFTAGDSQSSTSQLGLVSTDGGAGPLMTTNFLFNNASFDRNRSIINATNSIGTGIAATGIVGQFDDVSPTSVTENQFGNLRQDGKGILYATSAPTAAVGAGITPVVSASLESGHVLKASAGNLYSVYAFNSTATAGFLIVTNTTAVPADGAVSPIDWCILPASGSCAINNKPGPPGVYTTGISTFVSSNASPFTKTTGVITAAIHGEVQ